MMDREELIKKAIGFHKEANELIMEHRAEDWLLLDLTISQLKTLVYIYSEGRVSFRKLVRALDVTPSVLIGIIDRLMSEGMVNRTDNIEDNRIRLLIITDKGKALLDRTKQKDIKETYKIWNTFSDEDLSAFVRDFSAFLSATESYFKPRNRAVWM